MNVPFQICSFIESDVVCELVEDFSCFFHSPVYCFGLTAFCMWSDKGQAAWFGLAWLLHYQLKIFTHLPRFRPGRFKD